MANVIPGFIYQPINHAGRPKRRKGRGLVGHVAVSESANLRPWDANDWHAYLPREGPGIQYIDLDYVAFTNYDGSYSLASFESQGGTGSSAKLNAEPWSDNQCRLAATFLRHLHDTEDMPLQVMPDSRVSSRGFGTHRLGIDPWRVPGGEKWSRHRGKECPGNRKHEQRFDIVRLAAGLGDTPAPEPEDDDMPRFITDGGPWWLYDGFRRRYVRPGENQQLADLGLVKSATDIKKVSPADLARIPQDPVDPIDEKKLAEELAKGLQPQPPSV